MDYWKLLGDGWELSEVIINGEKACTVIVKGMEVHIEPHARPTVLRRPFQEVFEPIIEEWGFATTRVPHGFDDRFTRRIGFEETWKDGTFVYFMMTEVPFRKKGN